MLERLTATVADVQDVHRLVCNREKNPIDVRWAAVKEMPYLKRENRIFR